MNFMEIQCGGSDWIHVVSGYVPVAVFPLQNGIKYSGLRKR
jgi:hypothetical protein